MSQPVQLPDCTGRARGPVLSQRQRRELVRVLAEEGLEGMEAWIERESERDPQIRERVEAERERLERQARAEKRRLESAHEEERERASERWQREMQELEAQREELRQELEALEQPPSPHAEELAETAGLFRRVSDGEPTEDGDGEGWGLWTRLKRWLRRVWLFLVELWVRVVSWIRGRSTGDADAVVVLPDGVEVDLPQLMESRPGLRVEVRRRASEQLTTRERVRRWWRRLLGREDYADLVRELMAGDLQESYQRLRAQRQSEAEEVREELDRVERRRAQTRRERKEALREIDQDRDERVEEIEREVREGPYEEVRDSLMDELVEAGLVHEEGLPTHALLERFADLLYEDAHRALPKGGRTRPGAFVGGEGAYEKAPLRSLNERGAMALVDSAVRARQNHPRVNHLYDSDLLVRREIRSSSTHVVLVFDRSGSMEERGRFEAAKRVCLVMHRAVRDHDPRNRVDLLTMSTDVEAVDLEGCWNAELGGFTNHAAALRRARHLLEAVGADRKLVYLVTDGLPEAYLDEDGEPVVDEPSVCMAYAKEEARELARLRGVRLLVLQLETEDELYLDAAREIAEAAGGRLEGLDPDALTQEVLLDFEAQTE